MSSWIDMIESKAFGMLSVGVVTLATASVRIGVGDWRTFALAMLMMLVYWRLFAGPRQSILIETASASTQSRRH